ncbi:MAG: hypothetical protein OEM91_05520 [Hyphomicrobiales bacterium]|nr:hypothetical protein [Hyphomicrobiales bacterium]
MKSTAIALAVASTGTLLLGSIGSAAASSLLAPTAALGKTLNAQNPVQPVYYGYGGYRRSYGGYGRKYGYGRYYRGGHSYYGRGRYYRKRGHYYGYRGHYPYYRGYSRYYGYGRH